MIRVGIEGTVEVIALVVFASLCLFFSVCIHVCLLLQGIHPRLHVCTTKASMSTHSHLFACVSVYHACVCVCVRWFSLWYSRANGLFTSSQISGGIYSPCVGRRGQGGRIYSQEQSSSSFLVWFSPLTPLSLSSYTPLMLYSVSLLLFLPPIYSFPHNVFALSHLLSLLPTKYLLSHCLPP